MKVRDETMHRLGITNEMYLILSKYDKSSHGELNIDSSTKDEIRQNIDFDYLKCVHGVGEKKTQKIAMWLNGAPLPQKQKRKSTTFRLFGKKIRITLTIN
jgi:hypothetical protein